MLLSTKWLREYTPYEGTIDDLSHRLTMLGLEVEEVINPFAHIEPVVVGHVVECGSHPQADRLSLCKVDVGEGDVLSIVCGAPNVAADQKVAVAKVGTALPGGTIKKAKIRGEVSLGMICSEKELGLGDDQSGIMVLDASFTPGASLVDALDLDTVVLDIGITPNRADCLSVIGLAREVATAFDLPLQMPEINFQESGPDCDSQVDILIDDPTLCPLYSARIITGVKVGPSPAWMRYRLLASGMRPINNIVDVTNYVLMEMGQPQHAFDKDLIAGDTIRVGLASEGQKLITLDDQERTLKESDLLIHDGEKPVALAGVMGGANSEVHQGTNDVLLECAVFHPGTIRKTARRLALSSEASFRFERGVDQPGSARAVDRAASLMAELSGGTILPGVARNEPAPWSPTTLTFRRKRAESLLGIDLDASFCQRTLASLGCEVDAGGETWKVVPPSYRLDLEREVDLYEEVARVYGVDRIPTHLPKISKPLETPAQEECPFTFVQRIKDWARGVGLRESINYSFVGGRELDALGMPVEERIMVCNPMSSDQDTLRTTLAPGLLQNVRQNTGQGTSDFRLFEVAHVFFSEPESDTTAREVSRLGILLHGHRNPVAWPWKEQTTEYADLKGLVEHLLASFKLTKAAYSLNREHPFLEPCVSVRLDNELLGFLGRIKPEMADPYNPRTDVWLAELDLDVIRKQSASSAVCFTPLPKFPPVKRDITLISPKSLRLEEILAAVESYRPAFLEDVSLVDIYQPEDQNTHNLTFRLTYRHPEKTLKDKEVDKVHFKMAEELVTALPVRY